MSQLFPRTAVGGVSLPVSYTHLDVYKRQVKYPVLFAALVCVTVPMLLVYIAGQKTFIAGMTAGAVKG